MAKDIPHPTLDQIDLSAVLDALSDPIRREIVLGLFEQGEKPCSGFYELGSKTNLTYHYARLREAGVTRTRADGAQRLVSLRFDDLELRFPGLLKAVIDSAQQNRPASPDRAAASGIASRLG